VIGGAGSIGQAVVKEVFKRHPKKLHVVDINENTLDQYMQIYEARNGVACSEILDSNCEGCGAYIPPQVVNEALAKSIVYCGVCSRFLHKSEN
jgi:predicted  nucleic acid-binding Zn-ribbon protein